MLGQMIAPDKEDFKVLVLCRFFLSCVYWCFLSALEMMSMLKVRSASSHPASSVFLLYSLNKP